MNTERKAGKRERIAKLLKIIKPQPDAEKVSRFVEQLQEARFKDRQVTAGEVLNLNRKRG
jgi:hypothetical protein